MLCCEAIFLKTINFFKTSFRITQVNLIILRMFDCFAIFVPFAALLMNIENLLYSRAPNSLFFYPISVY